MTELRLAAIMKTDIGSSTPRFRALGEADLIALLVQHRELVSKISATHGARIIKSAGDGFWIRVPSATGAVLAAAAMQEEVFRTQSNKGDDRIAIRVVVTLGDVLDEGGDVFGDALALAARIETVTPPDEIYLSAAVRLAVSHAEVRTALVDTFPLKGFTEPVPVYRVQQRHRAQILKDKYIVWTDLRGFAGYASKAPIEQVEAVLDSLLLWLERFAARLPAPTALALAMRTASLSMPIMPSPRPNGLPLIGTPSIAAQPPGVPLQPVCTEVHSPYSAHMLIAVTSTSPPLSSMPIMFGAGVRS